MRTAITALGALALACASNAPQPPAKLSRAAPTADKPAPDERVDLSPVPRPDNVIVIGRVGSPGAFLDRLAEWQGGGGYARLVDDRVLGLGEHVAPGAPMDLIVAIERAPAGPAPNASLAISIGLSSLADARAEVAARDLPVRRGGPGVLLINEDSEQPCAVALARGVAPARLVCAQSGAALHELLPYATRGLPDEPVPTEDARFDVDVARFRAMHGKRLQDLKRWALPFARLGLTELEPRLANGLAPLLESIYDETLDVLGDVERIELTTDVEPTHADMAARITLGRDARSFFGQALLEVAPRQAAPPEDFWKLPNDSHFAFFSHGMTPTRSTALHKTISGTLARAARTPTPRSTFDLVVEALFPEPPFLYAFGLLEPKRDRSPGYAGRIRERTRRVLGWHVVGIETDAKTLEKRLDRGMKDYNAGPLRNLVYGEFPALCAGLPKITRRPAPRQGLPAGSVLYEMVVPGKLFEDCAARHGLGSKRPPAPLDIAVVFVPGKPRSWIVISPDTEFALAKMRELLSSEPRSALAASRAELAHVARPALFGAAISTELTSLLRAPVDIEYLGPPRSRAVIAVSAPQPKTILISMRHPAIRGGRAYP